METETTFSEERVECILDNVLKLLNEEEGLIKEKVYALSGALHAIGCTLYDREDYSKKSVEEDYNASPTWAAALILISHLPHEVLLKLDKAREFKEDNERT